MVADADGKAKVLNRPIQGNKPGAEQLIKLAQGKQLAKEEENWNQLTRAVAKVLRFA